MTSPRTSLDRSDLPYCTGVGLRGEHRRDWLRERPKAAFLEAHAETYLDDGPALAALEDLRRDYPVSLHSVALSITASPGPDAVLLAAVRTLVQRIQPALVSVHAAWMGSGSDYFSGLYPFPRTRPTLDRAVRGVTKIQDALGRVVLVENLAPMLDWATSEMTEPEFLDELARRSGCRLLLDVNNVAVGAANLGVDADKFLDAVSPSLVGQYHLAGSRPIEGLDETVWLDSHDRPVSEAVWALFQRALARFGPHPCVIEWDDRMPPLAELLSEAKRAEAMMAEQLVDVA